MFIRKGFFFPLLFFFSLLQTTGYAKSDTIISVRINAIGGLQYDLVRFKVKPGAKVNVVFTNKDDMSHNLLFTRPGARMKVVDAALTMGNDGERKNYTPNLPEVLWSFPLLSPGESQSITFSAPHKEGVYPFVCTYPGHGLVMYGAMYVGHQSMPLLKEDSNIPPERKIEKVVSNEEHKIHETQRSHSFRKELPYMYRIFLSDASPAAIAVHLPYQISYCWDAGTCRLRYAWQGGFLDNTDIWKGHHDSYGEIMGTVFYRDRTDFPLHVDKPGNIPAVKFKGYRLIKRYPEFHYQINGMEVFELMKPKEDGSGLIRTFRIPDANRTIWFIAHPEDGVRYQSSGGNWNNSHLKLYPDDAREFSIIMTKK